MSTHCWARQFMQEGIFGLNDLPSFVRYNTHGSCVTRAA